MEKEVQEVQDKMFCHSLNWDIRLELLATPSIS